MRKMSALFINELIKISQKFIILVMVGILLIGVFIFGYIYNESRVLHTDHRSSPQYRLFKAITSGGRAV